jgi:GT2 family glycosyltransferase
MVLFEENNAAHDYQRIRATTMQKIAIGMPVHEALIHTLRAIDKVLIAARDFEVEFYIIDDHSSPATVEVLQEECERIHATLLPPAPTPAPNLGYNVNRLLDSVSPEADYYLNLETDVFVRADTLHILVEKLNSRNDISAVFPLQVKLTPEGMFFDFHFCLKGYLRELPHELIYDCIFPWTHFGCLLVRGSDARNSEIRVDEDFKLFCADQDYTMRLQQVTGGKVLYTPDTSVIHIGHASSREDEVANPDPECFARIDRKWGSNG